MHRRFVSQRSTIVDDKNNRKKSPIHGPINARIEDSRVMRVHRTVLFGPFGLWFSVLQSLPLLDNNMYHSESGFLHGEVISLLTEVVCAI